MTDVVVVIRRPGKGCQCQSVNARNRTLTLSGTTYGSRSSCRRRSRGLPHLHQRSREGVPQALANGLRRVSPCSRHRIKAGKWCRRYGFKPPTRNVLHTNVALKYPNFVEVVVKPNTRPCDEIYQPLSKIAFLVRELPQLFV